jgi:HK97 family phage major capsid protein
MGKEIREELVDQLEEITDIFKSKAAKIDQLEKDALKNQEALDDLIIWKKSSKNQTPTGKKTFGEAFSQKIESEFNSRQEEFKDFVGTRSGKLTMELKTVGNMTTTASLTGDGVQVYGDRIGLVPNQKVNFRDLISSVSSPTGLYVSYRETGSEGAIDVQTEGSAKSQIDYDLTEVRTVSKYVAGISTFSKQLMFNLPFLQNTLASQLLRDFYKKENALFYATIAAGATGSVSSAETDDNKTLIDWIMGHLDSDLNASFIVINHAQKGRLLKSLFDSSNYLGGGGVVGTPNGSIQIAGVPIISASWMPDDKAMIIDTDFIQRVETESLRVEFSFENGTNFEKNLVTARVECFEELNLLRTDAHAVVDFGNES